MINIFRKFRKPSSLKHLRKLARLKGIRIEQNTSYIDFRLDQKTIRIKTGHAVYSQDIIQSFEYYFQAVRPAHIDKTELVDYSTGRYHEVSGFGLMPIFLPSFAEPLETTQQYLEFAKLLPGATVLDLGAYSGLTSIIFQETVGPKGKVIAVEADEKNISAIKLNFKLYEKISGVQIKVIHAAVWNHSNGLLFSSEGNMGSAPTSMVGNSRGSNVQVKSTTLSEIAEELKLKEIDFIKCDIEGGESVILDDKKFFMDYRPRIIIEPHIIAGELTNRICTEKLTRLGYECNTIYQNGVTLPLIECTPK